MKLKFRAEAKDIKIFIVFAILLFYLVAIALLNITEFINTATLHGLNPLPAFAPDMIGPVIVFYFAILIMIILSVKSYFFDREKGFGIKEGKKEESGYARWAKDSELKKELTKIDPKADVVEAGGIPLINNNKEMWVDNGEYHNLIIGSTGAGKTQIIVQPLVKVLAKHGESMIITDPKGEIYEKNAAELKEKGYNIVLLNFRDPQRGNAWNPLTLPYRLYQEHNSDKAIELLDDLALNILYDEKAQNQDPFWEKTSADYFSGLALGLFEDAIEEEVNINSINVMTTIGEQKIAGSRYINEYFSDKDPGGAAYSNASSTLVAPNDTRGSILSVFKQKIKLFATRENISEMLSYSDFDMKEIGRQKTAVFLVIQDEKKTYHPLVTIFLKQCYETLIDVAQENGGKLPFRTNFILDEFANMPPLKDVTTMITASRSRNIRFNFIIQNFAQLTQVYGKENGETIKGNCGNIIYLISSELNALEEISKMCGEKKSKKDDKTASTPLITVSDLQRLKLGDTIVLRIRTMPFRTKLAFNWQMEKDNRWGKNYEPSGYPLRERKPVKTFDLKTVVDEKVKKRREKMFGEAGGRNPMMGAGGPGMPRQFPPGGAMGGGMPSMFGGASNPMANPMSGSANPMSGGTPNGANLDDLMKRIDAQLAEIEKEEKAEKEKLRAKAQEATKDVSPSLKQEIKPLSDPKKEEKPEKAAQAEEKKPTPVTVQLKKEKQSIPDNQEFEIDQLLKRIDSRIAELEGNPKEEPTLEKSVHQPKIEPVIEKKVVAKPDEVKPTIENKPTTILSEETEKKSTTPAKKEEYVTDDQFFDDFFYDEEE